MIARRLTSGGFTLVELVAVIVLLGIVAVSSSQFIRQAVGIYSETAELDDMQQQSRFAIQRMSRELRNALPGSVRVDDDGRCVEFMPIAAASTYLQSVTDDPVVTLPVVAFNYVRSNGDLIAIYPIDNNAVYNDAVDAIAEVTAASPVGGPQQTLTIAANLFPLESPTGRFYIARNPVSFCATDNTLTRHAAYNRTVAQVLYPGNSEPLAESIRINDDGAAVRVFQYAAGTLQRAGLIHMDLRFSDDDGDWLRFSQDVFVRNVP